jgi:NifU-like protein
VWSDDHEEGQLICKCFAVDAVMIEDTIRANNLSTVQDVTNYTKAGGGCSSCHEGIEEILAKVLAERGETFKPGASAQESAPSGMTNLQRIRKIEAVLESVRPQLKRDGGDIELLDVDGKTIYVSMTGACAGCQMEALTLQGIQQKLMEELKEFIKIVPTKTGALSRATCHP